VRRPELVTITEGYYLCGVCGNLLLTGDTALFLNDAYCCVPCERHNVPQEWKDIRRIDAYLDTNPDTETPEYWENMLIGLEVNQHERQYAAHKDEADEDLDGNDAVPATGQRWNGRVLDDARDFLDELNSACDRPRVARAMVNLAESSVAREERQSLYRTMSRAELDADEIRIRPPFVDCGDERSSVG
jgi:hypothetical protein